LLIYTVLLIVVLLVKYLINRKINLNQPKSVKLEVVKETLMNKVNKLKSIDKELIIDYNFNYKFKTYLTSYITFHKYYTVNNLGNRQKIRIIISCNINKYEQVIFDKVYKLTDSYDLFLKDIQECTI
jgi:hypothetical protein